MIEAFIIAGFVSSYIWLNNATNHTCVARHPISLGVIFYFVWLHGLSGRKGRENGGAGEDQGILSRDLAIAPKRGVAPHSEAYSL